MRKKLPIYLQPMALESRLKQNPNPYIFDLSASLKKNFEIVNYDTEVKGGVLDIFFNYFNKSDIFYLNWVEHSNLIKAFFLLLLFPISKILKKKIIWTHHNTFAHAGMRWFDPGVLYLLTKYSDHIIVHTKESCDILDIPISDKRIIHFFHPISYREVVNPEKTKVEKKYDLLIWGRVRKSKGFIEFLQYLKDENKLNSYRIKVIGKFESEDHYNDTISKYSSASVEIENRFISLIELDEYHSQSKFVYFPYTGKSILNSAALVKSLPKGTPIIGPSVGAFKELGEIGLINLYSNFAQVLDYLDAADFYPYPYEQIKSFCKNHTFEKFSDFLLENLSVVEQTDIIIN